VSEAAHNYLAWRIGELEQHVALVARVKELEQQRDAAVAVLRDAREHPDYVDGDMKLYMPDVFDDALAALGAEEAK
jgi:hypothetical protein